MAGRNEMPAAQWLERVVSARRAAQNGHRVNLGLLGKMLSITPDYFRRKHIDGDPEFPVTSVGSEGRDYEFDVIAVLNHLFYRGHERLERERAEASRIARLTGASGAAGSDEPSVEVDGLGAVSVTDLGKIITVNQQLRRERQEQGGLIPAEKVGAFLIEYNSTVQSGILGTEQKVDPLGRLPVDVRVAVHDELSQLCVHVRDLVDKFLKPDEVVVPKRTARRG